MCEGRGLAMAQKGGAALEPGAAGPVIRGPAPLSRVDRAFSVCGVDSLGISFVWLYISTRITISS
jgi:hypothetical protein